MFINSTHNLVYLEINNRIINLLKMNSFVERAVGLLNRDNLLESQGVIFHKTRWLHTFGMKFPILIVCFDECFNVICNPVLANSRVIIKLPKAAIWVAEMHPNFGYYLSNIRPIEESKNNTPKIVLYSGVVLLFIASICFFVSLLLIIVLLNFV